jgi:hypothetical protein
VRHGIISNDKPNEQKDGKQIKEKGKRKTGKEN